MKRRKKILFGASAVSLIFWLLCVFFFRFILFNFSFFLVFKKFRFFFIWFKVEALNMWIWIRWHLSLNTRALNQSPAFQRHTNGTSFFGNIWWIWVDRWRVVCHKNGFNKTTLPSVHRWFLLHAMRKRRNLLETLDYLALVN